jgi:tetratricopeptide (TPR) repeat protein
LAVLLIALAAGPAEARVVSDIPPPPPPQETDIWHELVDPHSAEVNEITLLVQAQVIAPIDAGYSAFDSDVSSDQRERVLRVALGKLKYARKLAPENTQVLGLLGRVADELGNTRQALEALQMAYDLDGPAKVDPEVPALLGEIYLRLGEGDEAIRYLRLAESGAVPARNGEAAIALSTALALRGEMSDAIDVLVTAIGHNSDLTADEWGPMFALAVQYDRDDERAAAFETLDKLQNSLADSSYGQSIQTWISTTRFTPAEDEHYYSALFYESLDHYPEARAEWSLYAASGGAFRVRALQHVAAIDAERRAGKPKATTP